MADRPIHRGEDMPVKKVSNALKILWIIIFATIGAVVGAVLIGGFSSIGLSLVGGILGLIVGGLLGKYIPWFEWFS
tara:strand:- start:119 stop:346 length:228 start_codon:yes stop_codon:yes gene_type:complete